MGNQLVTAADMDYFAQQSAGNLNMIISGMTAIMKDTDNKVSQLEDQTWFQRMSNTLTGKNKMTLAEIQQNHDQINMYMTEALSELYNRNMMDHQIMIGLGNQINEVYAEQIQLKEMLGAFVNKLNEKIISIDNFHMLVEEINQKVFSNEPAIVAVSKIVTQIDFRTAKDQRKMEILSRSLTQSGIVNEKAEALIDVLVELLSMSENDAGLISMFLMGVENDYLSEIIAGALYEYYGMPERIRKFKDKKSVIDNYLKSKQIDKNMMISTQEIYSSIIDAYANSMIEYAIVEDNNKKKKSVEEYFESICEFMNKLLWAMEISSDCHDEYITLRNINHYYEYLNRVSQQTQLSAFIGSIIQKNSYNISAFFRKLFEEFPEINGDGSYLHYYEHLKQVNNGVETPIPVGYADSEGVINAVPFYKAVKEQFLDVINEKKVFVEDLHKRINEVETDLDKDLIGAANSRLFENMNIAWAMHPLQDRRRSYYNYDFNNATGGSIIYEYAEYFVDTLRNILANSEGGVACRYFDVDFNRIYDISTENPIDFPIDIFDDVFNREIQSPLIYVLCNRTNIIFTEVDTENYILEKYFDFSAGYVNTDDTDIYVYSPDLNGDMLSFQVVWDVDHNNEECVDYNWSGVYHKMKGANLYRISVTRKGAFARGLIRIFSKDNSNCQTYVEF